MIQKIKTALTYVGLPFLMLMGVIYALLQQTKGLKDQLQGKKRDEALGELAAKLKESHEESEDAESAYRAARDAYLRDTDSKS